MKYGQCELCGTDLIFVPTIGIECPSAECLRDMMKEDINIIDETRYCGKCKELGAEVDQLRFDLQEARTLLKREQSLTENLKAELEELRINE
jgi:hypothetical protein